ncbi:MAG: hypothetical protein ACXAC5_01625 [Promethearchaeota archaeon]|jgi:hypothetical protein
MTFEDLILNILDANSGGVKMTKLVTEVVCYCREQTCPELEGLLLMSESERSPFLDALDRKLEEMEAAGKLGLLHYAWPMTDDLVRQKTFVYLPLK